MSLEPDAYEREALEAHLRVAAADAEIWNDGDAEPEWTKDWHVEVELDEELEL